MQETYKPAGYNSLSPYFVVDNANQFIDCITYIFDAEITRKYDTPEGKIMHAEARIDDTIIMFANANENYPSNHILVHVYVEDVDSTFQKAMEFGCQPIQEPITRKGDPDKRGSFEDIEGNMWSVATQQQ